jgi:hypothetical protein
LVSQSRFCSDLQTPMRKMRAQAPQLHIEPTSHTGD